MSQIYLVHEIGHMDNKRKSYRYTKIVKKPSEAEM